jgi:hypothetical protein
MAVNGTTYGQRRAIREQAERELSGKTTTPSAKAFLRRRIPILRRQQEDGVLTKRNGESRTDRQSWQFEEPQRKGFGGIPSRDPFNPQRVATQARFGKEGRQAELEGKLDYELVSILHPHMTGDFGMALRDRDFEAYLDMKRYCLSDSSLMPYQKRKIIRVILEAEFPAQQETHSLSSGGMAHGSEQLRTDTLFLSRLTDAQLIEHAGKLANNRDFGAKANPRELTRLSELAQTKTDAFGHLYSWEKREILETIEACTKPPALRSLY